MAFVSDSDVFMMPCPIAYSYAWLAAVDWHSASFPVNHWQSGGAGAGVQSGTCMFDTKHPLSVMHACMHTSSQCISEQAWDWQASLGKQSSQCMYD